MHPTTDRIIAPSEGVGVVGMQTLDPLPSPAHSSRGARSIGRWFDRRSEELITLGLMGGMELGQSFKPDGRLGSLHPVFGFEASDRSIEFPVDQPESSGHWTPRVKEGRVFEHDGAAVVSPDHNSKCPLGFSAKQGPNQ